MNTFKPIEDVFPNWMAARILIESAVPKRISIRYDSEGVVTLDWSMLENLLPVVPEDDRLTYCRLLTVATKEVGKELTDAFDFSGYLKQPITSINLGNIEADIDEVDALRCYARKPMLLQVLRHEMGLKPCELTMMTTYKLK